MWKQTNLGYLRVDRLGCRLRRLASEGEPSLLDSVLDSTPRENTSARKRSLTVAYIGASYESIRFLRITHSTNVCCELFYVKSTLKRTEIVPLQGFTGTL